MKLFIFRFFWLFLFIGEYEQTPASLPTPCPCFGDGWASRNRELISSPPDVPWQTFDKQQLVDNYPYESQLGGQTIPQDYLLTITPDLQRGTFDGKIVIVVLAVEKTRTIKLNSEKLDVKKVTVSTCTVPGRNLNRTKFRVDVKRNFLIIKTSESLLVNKTYRVVIEFSGRLYRNNPFGFALYETKFTTTSKDAYAAETLLDPFFTRKAFPCYDEVHIRKPFSLEIILNENENAVSNARLVRTESVLEENKREKRRMTFVRPSSAPINTIYYAVLDEEYAHESAGEKYFVWTVKEFTGQASYAVRDLQSVAEKIESLIIYSGFFERIDLVVPIQREMQPGLLSYIKKNFLCDPEYCSEKHQEQVTQSIVHHVSNRLFGQYVSIRSWDYFWLTDGFGIYYGFRLTDLIKSSWGMPELHGSVVMQSILYDDRRYFLHPLTRPHNLSKEEIFETRYSKSHFEFYNGKASLIFRMLENIVGRSTFDKAIKSFLSSTLVRPDDLWVAFMRQIKDDRIDLKIPNLHTLQDVMSPFTTQAGYPLLIVTEMVDTRKIIIEQVPYGSTKKNSSNSKLESKELVDEIPSWIVPITITTQTKENLDTRPIAWAMPNSRLVLDTKLNDSEWYILNVKSTGYYRVNYPHDTWMKLVEQLKEDRSKIHPLNRAQLIGDSHVLVVDTKLEITIPIEMTTYLTNEDDPMVWMVALNQFKRFYMALTEKLRPAYKQFFVGCLKNEYNRTGFKIDRNDSHADKIWKSELLKFLCWIGDQECITEAEKMYTDSDNPANIEPNLQHVVFCTMLQRRDPSSVMVSLEQMVKRNNNSCLRDVVQDVSACSYAPVGNENLIRIKFESLLSRAMAGDPSVESIMNDILSNFDTLLPLLKLIKDHITQMSETGRNNTNIKQNLDGLSKFVGILKEKRFGLAESILFLELYKDVQKLEKKLKMKYTSLGIAFLNIIANFKGGVEDLQMQESLLSNLLQTTKCDPKMSESPSSSRGSVSALPPPPSDSTVDVSAAIRDILNESESSITGQHNVDNRQDDAADEEVGSNF